MSMFLEVYAFLLTLYFDTLRPADFPPGEPAAVLLFALCFTCGKYGEETFALALALAPMPTSWPPLETLGACLSQTERVRPPLEAMNRP